MRMPTLYVGHGTPMNAILDNGWSRAFAGLANEVPKPKTILSVSGHFYVPGIFVTDNERPPTIHDFGGFPKELFEIEYPCPGDPPLAGRVSDMLNGAAQLTDQWGLDHGTWSVLRHMYPDADVPVVQLSIDQRLSGDVHVAIGRALAPLRDEGVLIVGSGMSFHNLRVMMRGGSGTEESRAFDAWLGRACEASPDERDAALARWEDAPSARFSHPREEHLLPLMVAAGAAAGEPGRRIFEDDVMGVRVSAFELGGMAA